MGTIGWRPNMNPQIKLAKLYHELDHALSEGTDEDLISDLEDQIAATKHEITAHPQRAIKDVAQIVEED
jgi:hypothetical protein